MIVIHYLFHVLLFTFEFVTKYCYGLGTHLYLLHFVNAQKNITTELGPPNASSVPTAGDVSGTFQFRVDQFQNLESQ